MSRTSFASLTSLLCMAAALCGQSYITNVSVSGGDVVLKWEPWADYYVAQGRTSLTTGDWSFVGDVVTTSRVALTNTLPSRQIFRVREVELVEFLDPAIEQTVRSEIVVKHAPEDAFYDIDLEALTTLDLAGKGITNIWGLEFASGATELDIGDRYRPRLTVNRITDIRPLAALTNLTVLKLAENNISDLAPLRGLTRLSRLDLFRNNVRDLSPLTNLSALTWLRLGQNEISDLTPLGCLTNLQWLSLGKNHLTDVRPLSTLQSLEDLSLHRNAVDDLTPLLGLTALRRLDIGKNPGIDCEPVSQMTNLRTLLVYGNDLSDIGFLASLENLETIHLAWNPIKSLDVLADLTNMTSIQLYGVPISNLAALVSNSMKGGLGAGDWLDLPGCRLTAHTITNEIPFLRSQGVTVRFDEDRR